MHNIDIVNRWRDLCDELRRKHSYVNLPVTKNEMNELQRKIFNMYDSPEFKYVLRKLREEGRNLMLEARSDRERLEAQVAAMYPERFEQTLQKILTIAGNIEAEQPEEEQGFHYEGEKRESR